MFFFKNPQQKTVQNSILKTMAFRYLTTGNTSVISERRERNEGTLMLQLTAWQESFQAAAQGVSRERAQQFP